MRDISFSNRELTLGELIDSQLAMKGDVAAWCRFLASRSGAEEAIFRAMTLAELTELIPDLNASLGEAAKIGNLAIAMSEKADPAKVGGGN